MDKKLIVKTFVNATGSAIYIFIVSQIMQNGDKLFGKEDNMLAPFAALLLFSLSAAVVGGLILGNSLVLFLEGKRNESVKAAVYSISWLGLYTILGLLTLVILK